MIAEQSDKIIKESGNVQDTLSLIEVQAVDLACREITFALESAFSLVHAL